MAEEAKIFQINECDWFVATSLEEAVECAEDLYGEEVENEDGCKLPYELSKKELQTLKIYWGDPPWGDESKQTSFQKRLDFIIEKGETVPALFASEY